MAQRSDDSRWKYLEAFTGAITRPVVYLLLLAVFAGLFVWMEVPGLPYSAADFSTKTNGGSQLDMMIGYSPEKAYELIEGYGADGRTYYVRKLVLNDLVFPVAYSLLFAGTLALLLKYLTGADSRLRYLAVLPLAGGALDLAENASIITMLLAYPARMEVIATATSLVTAVKLGINATAVALILLGLVVAAYCLVRKRLQPRV
ncbi:hypothetical protein [Methanocella sp. MCL-LM]|uniref:hypothetical protein n=1 Tax=Methanocella sp. MCL-LM TaxID=3412035 RepID=UPI003C710768